MLLVSLALLLWPAPAGTPVVAMRGAAVVLLTIGLFATGVVAEHVAALGFFLLAVLLGVAKPATVFAGFASGSLWLVVGGMALGIAVKETGLGERVARALFARFSGSYPRLVAAVIGVTFLLSVFIPSGMARLVLLFPVVMSLADQVGLARGRRGRTGLALALGMTIFNPPVAILPSVVPNLILAGAAETIYGLGFTYGWWLVLHLPVTGLLKAVSIFVGVCALFPDRCAGLAPALARAPMSGAERRLALLLMATVGLWMTDALHGVSPAWVALAAGLFCLLPRLGFAPAQSFNQHIPLGLVVYIAATLGMGSVIVETGLGAAVGRFLLDAMGLAPGAPAGNFVAMVALSTLATMVVTVGAVPAVIAPLAGDMARAAAMGLEPVLMSVVLGYSTVFLPYQAPPLMVAMQMGGIPVGTATRLTLALGAASALMLPLTYLWWQLIGFWR